MSENRPEISLNSIGQSISKVLTRIRNLKPSSGEYPAIVSLFTSGSFLVVGYVAAITAIGWISVFFAKVQISAPSIARSAIALVGSALGATVKFGAESHPIPGSAASTFEATARPTLLTILVIWTAITAARRGINNRFRGQVSFGWGTASYALGVSATLWLGILVASGSVSFEGSVVGHLGAPSLRDFLVAFLIVWIPVAWFNRPSRVTNSQHAIFNGWAWSRKTLVTFSKLFFATATIAVLVFGVINIIRPNFVFSVEEPTEIWHWSAREVIAPIAIFLVMLPTTVLYALLHFCGVAAGFDVTPFGKDTEFVDGIINFLTGHANESALSIFNSQPGSLGWALVVLAALSGIASGALAAISTGYIPTWAQDARKMLVTSLATATFLVWFTEFRLNWTNNAVPERIAAQGQVVLNSGYARFGLGLGSFIAFSVGLLVLSLLGAKTARDVIGVGMPTIRKIFAGSASPVGVASTSSKVVGKLILVSFAIWIIIPISGATYERNWAIKDGPNEVVTKTLKVLEQGNPRLVAKEFGIKFKKKEWLSQVILHRAMTTWEAGSSEQSNLQVLPGKYSLDNSHERTWKLGELDVVSKVSWTKDQIASKFNYSMTGDVFNRYKVLRHADYSWTDTPFTVTLVTGPFYPKSLNKQIRLNGELVRPGKYFAVPGFYTITAPGSGIINATSGTVSPNGNDLVIEVGTKGVLPAAITKKVNANIGKQQAACRIVSTDLENDCSSDYGTYSEMIPGSESVPDYDDYKVKNVKTKKLKCSSTDSVITSTSSVTFSKDCTQDITFSVAWIVNAITEDVTKEVEKSQWVEDGTEDGECIDYDYDFEYCNEYEQVPYGHTDTWTETKVVGQKIIEPAKVYTRKYTSSVDFTLTTSVKKLGKNSFKFTP